MNEEIINRLKQKLEKVIEVFKEDLATIRTGRAKPDLVENVLIEAYGGKMKLFEVANISAPDPSLITVTPWDKSLVKNIEKAISESQLQLSTNVSGDMIRIPVPALTQERRQDL